MQRNDHLPGDSGALRRYLRDLSALAALPGAWARADRRHIAQSLAEVLVKVLGAEVVGVRLRGQKGKEPIEVSAHAPGTEAADKLRALRRAMGSWLDCGSPVSALAAPVAFADDAVQAAVAPIGLGCEFGVLAVSCSREDFPAEGDRLLLGVAAGQAAMALQHQRAAETQALLAAIVESSNDAIVSKTLEGIVTSWNAAAEHLFGYSRDEAVGKSITLIIPPDRLDEERGILDRLCRGERIDRYETVRRAKDGRLLDISLTISPIRDASGAIVGASKIAHDVSARQEAARRKDAFLAMLAHELRNPLAPIRSAVQVLRAKGPLEADMQWARDVIDRQAQQLTRLVDDLLDVSRITRDTIGLRPEVIDLAVAVGSAIDASRPLIEERRHELQVMLPPAPVRIEADPVRLAQILANLLNNAAKYTDPGGRIWLTVEHDGDAVALRVRDTGIGIDATALPRIFDMFAQGEHARQHAGGGLGVGLTLVRRLVEMHGGTVTAHSKGPGTGAEFVVRLPVGGVRAGGETDGEACGEAGGAHQGRCRILLVDDNVDATDSLSILLGLHGHEVHTAYDGAEAVELAGKLRPEVVVLDIGLPTLDGYEAARRIRRLPGGPEMVLIALTGWGQEEDRRRSREAGFDHHLTKPVEVEELQRFLMRRVPCAAPHPPAT